MNKELVDKINQEAVQRLLYSPEAEDNYFFAAREFQLAFAEGIVRECIKVIDPTGDLTSIAEDVHRNACMNMIKERFDLK